MLEMRGMLPNVHTLAAVGGLQPGLQDFQDFQAVVEIRRDGLLLGHGGDEIGDGVNMLVLVANDRCQ